tara:strand:+ start:1228 stop:1719 length:492 start_codon:yes stop_codon:yes gene_type:complete
MRKKLILDTARRLYNERGLSNVTIRQIAQEMNISSGNLTYHFEKRGDLVKGVFQDLISIENKFISLYRQTTLNNKQLNNLMRSHAKAMFHYRFFWIDFVQVGRENPNTQKNLDLLMQNRLNELDYEWANYLNQFLYLMATSKVEFTSKAFEFHFKKLEDKVFC